MTDPDLAAQRASIDGALARICERHIDVLPNPIGDAVRYSLLGGGKRFRGILFLAAYDACGGERVGSDGATGLAAAIEIVHAYSLVHDDLPCMDDDDLRRGRPTVHRVFGVPAATAAGVVMVPLACLCAREGTHALGLSDAVGGAIVAELMRASGAGGMIGGQLLDLEGEERALALDELERIHRAKTGALITAAAGLGGTAAGAPPERIAALGSFGASVGLAFQIADDVLDVTATSDVLGKTAGKDLLVGKSTYPALLGVEGATARAEKLVEHGCRALSDAGLLTPVLAKLARFIVARRS